MSVEPALVTAAQAALWCGVSEATVRDWVRRGYLSAVKAGAPHSPALFDLADVVRCERSVRHRRSHRLDI